MPRKASSTSRSPPPRRSTQQQQRTLTEALRAALEARRCACIARRSDLIGGAVLRAGDLVIDGSLRTRLDRIAYELTA